MPAWLITILSVMAGGALTIITGWISDKRLSERERERRAQEREERLAIRRDDFQRETLLALQVAVQKMVRTTGKMHHEDVMAHRSTGQWQRQLFSEDLSDDSLRNMTDTMLLGSRVRDSEARTLADQLREQCTAIGGSPDEQTAEARMATATITHERLIGRIGQLLREMDEAD